MPRLAAVLGDPVDHSLSPVLHDHWLRRYGIRGHYVPVHVEQRRLPTVLESLQQLGFAGVNVTVPHKEQVLQLSDSMSEAAQRIGAANTLTFTASGIHADNTDAYGFTWNILDAMPGWQPRHVTLLGAGGASRAVLAALMEQGAFDIRLVNRNLARAEALATEFGASVQPVPWTDRHDCLKGCDTLINATTLGMIGKPELTLNIDELAGDALVTDLVYTPLETALLAIARQRGNPVIDGFGMLLHQAVPAFERWFGKRPVVDQDLRNAVLQKS